MKKTILVAMIFGSALAFAKAEDQSGFCNITGHNRAGAVTFNGPTVTGGWWKARKAAYKSCNAKGLSNCKVNWCRINN